MSVSDEILKRMADAYRRIRNTARFLLANLKGFDPAVDTLPADELLQLDRWAVGHAQHLQEQILEAYQGFQFHQIYQLLHHFCTVEMGGFYLDIIKDRQYTTQADSLPRRSAQTAMYHIVEAMVRWMAPILSFTADEIWEHIPGPHADSVFLDGWYQGLETGTEDADFSLEFWQEIIVVREAVSKELERLRVAGGIGSSLDAEVDLYCDPALKSRLDRLQDELRFVLISSYARIHPAEERRDDAVAAEDLEGLWLAVSASAHPKCVRCWHHREDVGIEPGHPELCGRCVDNIEGDGEVRTFA